MHEHSKVAEHLSILQMLSVVVVYTSDLFASISLSAWLPGTELALNLCGFWIQLLQQQQHLQRASLCLNCFILLLIMVPLF